jgi:hypothetical protein
MIAFHGSVNVSISTNSSRLKVEPSSVTLDLSSWRSFQTITITAFPDYVTSGFVSFTIEHTPDHPSIQKQALKVSVLYATPSVFSVRAAQSVSAAVGAVVVASVGTSVGASVGSSIGASVGSSAGGSVGGSTAGGSAAGSGSVFVSVQFSLIFIGERGSKFLTHSLLTDVDWSSSVYASHITLGSAFALSISYGSAATCSVSKEAG